MRDTNKIKARIVWGSYRNVEETSTITDSNYIESQESSYDIFKTIKGFSCENANIYLEKNMEKINLRYEELEKKMNRTAEEYMDFLRLRKIIGRSKGGNMSHITDKFDKIFFPNGIIDSEIYTVTGASGKGKTGFCCMLTASLISGNNPHLENSTYPKRSVIYVTLEQPVNQIVDRIISTLSAFNNFERIVPYVDITSGNYTSDENLELALKLYELHRDKLHILGVNQTGLNIENILSVIEDTLFDIEDKPVVIIDQYVNVANTSSPTNEDVIMAIKNFARKNKVPVFLQTQMSKEAVKNSIDKNGEMNADKLSSTILRGTSGLEHQSTMILTITQSQQVKDLFGQVAVVTEIKSVKNRMGTNGSCKFLYFGSCNMIFDYEENRGRPKKE